MKRIVCLLVFSIFIFGANAQTVEDILSKYTEENGRLYLQPFADAFSADFNSGLFHNAKVKKKGFQIYIGVVAQVATISNSAKYFNAYTDSDLFPPQGSYKVPTIFGPTDEVSVPIEGTSDMYHYVFPGGLDVDYLPLAMPQITVGSLFGTDFTARYITLDVDDYGKLDVFGWGVRHSIDQYFSALPVDLSVGYYNQSFKVGEYMDAKTNVINLQTSITMPVLTFYGGLGYESSNVDVQYIYEGADITGFAEEGDEIRFEMEGANTIRATIGVCFNLGPIKIHGDYNVAKQNTFAVGLGIGINEN